MFDDPAAGNGCGTACVEPEQFTERAVQISWNTCVQEDQLLKWCRGSDPVADPLDVIASNESRIRAIHNQKYILANLIGIMNSAAAAGDSQIICDFTAASFDGTPNLSLENMALATSELAVRPDYYVADHITIRKLRAQGFQPFCCGDDGQVRNSLTDLVAPDGQRIVQLDKKFSRFFDINGDGSKLLLIGMNENSVGFVPTTENDTSDIMRGFNPFFFDQPSKCRYACSRIYLHGCD
jgi:hypothetical protein